MTRITEELGGRPVRVNPSSAAFRPEIEGLRAIAIFLVVGYHAAIPGFAGGYIGVDVFFVLSGYLITGLLVREIEQTGHLDLLGFYARRARRLLPALALTVVATMMVSALIFSPAEQQGFAKTAMSTAAYTSNLYFALARTNYAYPDREDPLLHTWSLSVEEQFYLVWPVFVMFALNGLSGRSHGGTNHLRLLLWMIAAAAISFSISGFLTNRVQPWAFFTSPTRAWEFAFGAIVVLLSARGSMPLPGWLGLGGIVIASITFNKTVQFPGLAALLPALSTALVLHSTARTGNSILVTALSTRPLQEIGKLSYSWYLWHWPVLVFGAALLRRPSLPARAALVAISLAISIVSYRFFENPIRHHRVLAKRPIYALSMAGLLALFGISMAFVWNLVSLRATEKPEQARFTLARSDGPILLNTTHCMAGYSDTQVKNCSFADVNSPVSMVLLGDSHAAQWFPAFESIAKKKSWRLFTLTKAACAPVEASYFYPALGRTYTECGQWLKNALHKIEQLRPVLTVVTSSDTYSFDDAEWKEAISPVLRSLSKSSQSVLILRDNPKPDFDMPDCLAREKWRPAFISSEPCRFSYTSESDVYESLKLAAGQFSNVIVTDISRSICPAATCTGERDGIVIYSDGNHLTASFVNSLEPAITEQIDKAMNYRVDQSQ
jgi:peptidoglycan/LPS O-acetylase OafA/YrhL